MSFKLQFLNRRESMWHVTWRSAFLKRWHRFTDATSHTQHIEVKDMPLTDHMWLATRSEPGSAVNEIYQTPERAYR